MNKAGIILLIPFLFYYSCRQHAKHTNAREQVNNDTAKFFDVTHYIQSQIADVNKTPYFIYKLTVTNGKKDSVAINTDLFNTISVQFLKPDINDTAFKKRYTESIFHDLTTKSFTISYTSSDKQLEIQNVEVLLQEDGETVKRIFIRKFFNYSDSSAIEQLSWKPGQSFQINRLVQKTDNKEIAYQTNVIWNEKS